MYHASFPPSEAKTFRYSNINISNKICSYMHLYGLKPLVWSIFSPFLYDLYVLFLLSVDAFWIANNCHCYGFLFCVGQLFWERKLFIQTLGCDGDQASSMMEIQVMTILFLHSYIEKWNSCYEVLAFDLNLWFSY